LSGQELRQGAKSSGSRPSGLEWCIGGQTGRTGGDRRFRFLLGWTSLSVTIRNCFLPFGQIDPPSVKSAISGGFQQILTVASWTGMDSKRPDFWRGVYKSEYTSRRDHPGQGEWKECAVNIRNHRLSQLSMVGRYNLFSVFARFFPIQRSNRVRR